MQEKFQTEHCLLHTVHKLKDYLFLCLKEASKSGIAWTKTQFERQFDLDKKIEAGVAPHMVAFGARKWHGNFRGLNQNGVQVSTGFWKDKE